MNLNIQKNIWENALNFIVRYKKVLSFSGAGILIIVLLFLFLDYSNKSTAATASKLYDKAFFSLNSIGYVTNQAERLEIYQAQVNNMISLVQLYPNTISAEKARIFLGRAFYEDYFQTGKQESLNMSFSYYSTALERAKVDFYRALSLIGRAQCYEQQLKFDKAFEDYSIIATKLTKEGFAPLALVGMARCKEQLNDYQSAINYYQKIIDDYPQSEWTRFARSKLYYFGEQTENQFQNMSTNNVLQLMPQ